MAAIYYKYRTDFNNTIIAQSGSSFLNLDYYERQIFSGNSTILNGSLFNYKYNPDHGTIEANDYETLKRYTGYTYYLALPVQYSTLSSMYVSKATFEAYTGNTSNDEVSDLEFSQYTGVTAPSIYKTRASFNTYSAATLTTLNSKLLGTTFNTFTGTTAPATYASKSIFNSFTGTTNTRLNTIETNYVSGATNLGTGATLFTTKASRRLQLKTISPGKNIGVSGNTNQVVIYSNPEIFVEEKLTTQTSTSATFADYDSATINLTGGNYKITYSIIYGHSATNQNFNIEFRRAGVNVFPVAYINRMYVNTARESVTQVKYATLAAGSHTFSIAISTAGGTLTMYYGLMLIEKI